jgi:NarL family two-component system response regulator LiaR
LTAIRVLIADDHAVVRQGLRTFLELQDEIEVVGEAADGIEALDLVQRTEPDVALLDLVMPRLGGLEAIRRIREVAPATRVLVLTSFADDDTVLPAVRAGAAGYLLKDVEPAELVRAIHTVADGEALLHPAVAARLMEEFSEVERPAAEEALTAREREVLELIARGSSNKEIAQKLVIAENTVKVHLRNILDKLQRDPHHHDPPDYFESGVPRRPSPCGLVASAAARPEPDGR